MSPFRWVKEFKPTSQLEKILVSVLVLFGVILRVRQYLTGRSLWLDEAMLALNIVNRDFFGLFKPLDYNQGAPLGFLLVQKVFTMLLGKSEFVLRFFPFLMGLLSLFFFYLLLKHTTKQIGLLLALALFVVNPSLIYFTSEAKQYIVDVAVTIGLFLVAAPLFDREAQNDSPASRKDFFWLALAGLLALWFSHSALFVLAGIGVTLMILYLQRHDFERVWQFLGIGALWLANLGILYLITLQGLWHNSMLLGYWKTFFVPSPPWSDLNWFSQGFRSNLAVEFGMYRGAGLVFGLMLVGWIALFLEKRAYAGVLALTLLFTLIASSLQLYPVIGRLSLFFVPLGLLLIGKALETLASWLKPYPWLALVIPVLLGAYLLYDPFVTSTEYLVKPKYSEHIRPTLEFLKSSWKNGDELYVSFGAMPAFQFYAQDYNLENVPYVFGLPEDYSNPQIILSRLESFQGKRRVWILLSHVYAEGTFNEKDLILNYLNQTGQKKREFRVPGTSVFLYLYDLKN